MEGTSQQLFDADWLEYILLINEIRMNLADESMLDYSSVTDTVVCFEYDKTTNKLIMSEEVLRIFGLKRASFSGSTEEFFWYFKAEDRKTIQVYLSPEAAVTNIVRFDCQIVKFGNKRNAHF